MDRPDVILKLTRNHWRFFECHHHEFAIGRAFVYARLSMRATAELTSG